MSKCVLACLCDMGIHSHDTQKSRTSSSLQALPPPVDEFLRWCFVIPYSWRSITSDVGVYMAECMAIVIVGDMMTVLLVVGPKNPSRLYKNR